MTDTQQVNMNETYQKYLASLQIGDEVEIMYGGKLITRTIRQKKEVSTANVMAFVTYLIERSTALYFSVENGNAVSFCSKCNGGKFKGYKTNIYISHPDR